jgi:hypothetical protein
MRHLRGVLARTSDSFGNALADSARNVGDVLAQATLLRF